MATLDRDGVHLFYEDVGEGDPPFVFVHGWCCDHTYFAPQAAHFGTSHRAVSVDLRGHGQSDKPQQDYSIAGFADDVAWLCRELGLPPAVVVGHSMGGAVALELAATHSDVVAGAVLVDPAPFVKPPDTVAMLTEFIAGLRSDGHREVQRGFIEGMLFLPTDDAVIRGRVVDEMTSAAQHVAASAMEAVVGWDGSATARNAKVPVLDIVATTPFDDPAAVRALNPELITTGQTVGAGHFNQLLVPDQVNAMIEAFLRTSLQ